MSQMHGDDSGADDRIKPEAPRQSRRAGRRRDDGQAEDYDDDDLPSIRRDGLDRGALRVIAIYQKILLICVLVYVILVGAQFLIPADLQPITGLIAIPTVLTATVFVFLLSTKVYSVAWGVVLGLLTLIPCVGLLVLLRINGKATDILRTHGIRVGLLGANLSDLN